MICLSCLRCFPSEYAWTLPLNALHSSSILFILTAENLSLRCSNVEVWFAFPCPFVAPSMFEFISSSSSWCLNFYLIFRMHCQRAMRCLTHLSKRLRRYMCLLSLTEWFSSKLYFSAFPIDPFYYSRLWLSYVTWIRRWSVGRNYVSDTGILNFFSKFSHAFEGLKGYIPISMSNTMSNTGILKSWSDIGTMLLQLFIVFQVIMFDTFV